MTLQLQVVGGAARSGWPRPTPRPLDRPKAPLIPLRLYWPLGPALRPSDSPVAGLVPGACPAPCVPSSWDPITHPAQVLDWVPRRLGEGVACACTRHTLTCACPHCARLIICLTDTLTPACTPLPCARAVYQHLVDISQYKLHAPWGELMNVDMAAWMAGQPIQFMARNLEVRLEGGAGCL
jgi:hypothetical protein